MTALVLLFFSVTLIQSRINFLLHKRLARMENGHARS